MINKTSLDDKIEDRDNRRENDIGESQYSLKKLFGLTTFTSLGLSVGRSLGAYYLPYATYQGNYFDSFDQGILTQALTMFLGTAFGLSYIVFHIRTKTVGEIVDEYFEKHKEELFSELDKN